MPSASKQHGAARWAGLTRRACPGSGGHGLRAAGVQPERRRLAVVELDQHGLGSGVTNQSTQPGPNIRVHELVETPAAPEIAAENHPPRRAQPGEASYQRLLGSVC
jgi:hypothetical protein